jgi:hypothetical protein
MDLEDTDPQKDPNIRFQVVIRGWSNENQQTRARTLLALSVDKMVNSLQRQEDIILIPRHWWSVLQNTLGPEVSGWWYTVSKDIYFQEYRSCERRLDKDHQDVTRCPRCPVKISRLHHNYAEADSDDANMEEDSEEIQQNYLCTSTDPSRIGVGGGETIILSSSELCKVITL